MGEFAQTTLLNSFQPVKQTIRARAVFRRKTQLNIYVGRPPLGGQRYKNTLTPMSSRGVKMWPNRSQVNIHTYVPCVLWKSLASVETDVTNLKVQCRTLRPIMSHPTTVYTPVWSTRLYGPHACMVHAPVWSHNSHGRSGYNTCA